MPDSLSRSRIDSFSDGVLAVIITIMVLELKVPATQEISDQAVLLSNAKIFAIYLLSFVQVGIYWVNHHYLLDDLETVSHGVLWANLGLLFALSLIPFGLEWIGARGITPVAVAVYSGCYLLPAWAWVALAKAVQRRTGIPPAAGMAKQIVSACLSIAAIPVALRSPWTALAFNAIVALMWLAPPRRIVEKTRSPRSFSPGTLTGRNHFA
jgi:uncharacterized membrane protein